MDFGLTYWFYKRLQTDNQCFLYNGNINNEITSLIMEIGKMNLENQEENKKVMKRVMFLMGECFQNIIRHGSLNDRRIISSDDPCFFMSRNTKNNYYITSCNLVQNQNIPSLKNHIDEINSLNREELKEKYTTILSDGEFTSKGGAGLGMIDMARKSGHKLGYRFEEYDNNSSYFYNKVIFSSQPKEESTDKKSFEMDFAIELYQKMTDNNILLIYKGDFLRESILPIMKIIEDNLEKERIEEYSLQKVNYIMVELLQNISQHGYSENNRKDGIVILTKNGEVYSVLAGNLVEKEKVGTFDKYLQKITNTDKQQLKQMYLSRLKRKRLPGERPGLGLIQLSRICSEKLYYRFNAEDNITDFYTVKARI